MRPKLSNLAIPRVGEAAHVERSYLPHNDPRVAERRATRKKADGPSQLRKATLRESA